MRLVVPFRGFARVARARDVAAAPRPQPVDRSCRVFGVMKYRIIGSAIPLCRQAISSAMRFSFIMRR
jgi:hypothetical protein